MEYVDLEAPQQIATPVGLRYTLIIERGPPGHIDYRTYKVL